MRRALVSGSVLLLLSSALPAFAIANICGQLPTSEQALAAHGLVTTGIVTAVSSLDCINVSGLSATLRARSCVSSIICAGSPDVQCCAPETGGRAGATGACVDDPEAGITCPTVTTGGGGFMRLELPACTKNGDCTLDDIVQTGVNFANFLFGISGAILLATFVYAGVLYLTAGSGESVSKAKDMLKNAVIGMILVFGAGLLVSTVYDTFRSDSAGGSDTCTTSKPGFSCQYLSSTAADTTALQAEMTSRRCVADLCAGAPTRACCPETGTAP